MMNVSEEQVALITNAVVRAVAPQRVILFGSQARETAKETSDIDLLIISPSNLIPSRRLEIARIRRSLPSLGIPIDILLFTPEEVEKWKGTTNHIIGAALREGKVLYERP
jgi:predicted nucleotidyltransferase